MRSLFRFFSIGISLVLVTACDGGGDTEALKQAITVNKLNLESVVLKPTYSETLNSDVTYFDTDDTETIIATANSENGTNISNDVTWSTSNSSIAQIDQNGLLSTFAATGVVTVYAKIGNVQGALNIYVSDAQLSSVEYRYKSSSTPINGGTNDIVTLCDTVPLEVVGTFADTPATQRIITEKLEWVMDMSSPVGARITNNVSNKGVFSAYTYTDQGVPFVVSTAYKGIDQTSLSLQAAEMGSEGTVFVRSTLSVSPLRVGFPVGDTEQLQATAQFTTGGDNVTKDITNNVEWVSADTNIATVSNTGLVRGVTSSTTAVNITAQCTAGVGDADTATSEVTITDAATVIAVEIRSASNNNKISDPVTINLSDTNNLEREYLLFVLPSVGDPYDVTADADWEKTEITNLANDPAIDLDTTTFDDKVVVTALAEGVANVKGKYNQKDVSITISVEP